MPANSSQKNFFKAEALRLLGDRKDRSAMTKLLWQMEHAGFLEQRISPAERRARELYLTRKGRELAKRLRSSQSRVAKMEASDPAVSIDLLIRALLAAGAKKKDIAKAIAQTESLAA